MVFLLVIQGPVSLSNNIRKTVRLGVKMIIALWDLATDRPAIFPRPFPIFRAIVIFETPILCLLNWRLHILCDIQKILNLTDDKLLLGKKAVGKRLFEPVLTKWVNAYIPYKVPMSQPTLYNIFYWGDVMFKASHVTVHSTVCSKVIQIKKQRSHKSHQIACLNNQIGYGIPSKWLGYIRC